MINFANTEFIKSINKYEDRPFNCEKEILIIGKSNVGKSSFINALTNKKNLAYKSSKPGLTKLINFYLVDKKFFLVDTPGYGYSLLNKREDKKFEEMMENYFTQSKNIALCILLLDSRREVSDNDLEMISFLEFKKHPFIIVGTKSDKLNQKEKNMFIKNINVAVPKNNNIILTSSLNKDGFDKIKRLIENYL